ncbi:hypothetical protein ATANTOWER_017854 [Ataeniobius toweri]|uniref:Uncharacterized protein n=1 Tax=Ataeniobius toweri TaxID=208326 RepID=A0ABU7BJB4_9TELE|nr:hypothetical protein [Ataeniobius toweri]
MDIDRNCSSPNCMFRFIVLLEAEPPPQCQVFCSLCQGLIFSKIALYLPSSIWSAHLLVVLLTRVDMSILVASLIDILLSIEFKSTPHFLDFHQISLEKCNLLHSE